MNKSSISLRCPKCHLSATAVLSDEYRRFIIYTCPRCKSNVTFYNNKIDVISNKLLSKLLKKGKLKFCGNVQFDKKSGKDTDTAHHLELGRKITKDDILDLKILLETEPDLDKIISVL